MSDNRYKVLDPKISAWISASAGTGKTKILTDRILNLLISGESPKNILCLTFTKAARGEMLTRINKILFSLSLMNNSEIEEFLKALTNKSITAAKILFTKNLYSSYNSSNNKIKIYTIHAFCQSILQKFPFEAGLKPSFEVIDENNSFNIIKSVINTVDFYAQLPDKFTKRVSLFNIENVLYENVVYLSGQNVLHQEHASILEKNLLKKHEIISNKKLALCLDSSQNLNVLKELHEQTYDKIISFIEEYDLEENLYNIYSVFLTQSGDERKKLLNKKESDNFPYLLKYLESAREVVKKHFDYRENSFFMEYNKIAIDLAKQILNKYQSIKQSKNYLDYNDLIKYTYNLLNLSSSREWIKYKLDGGINHILVDESQDTSQTQWDIINSIIQDFFSGETISSGKNKSIFVVGDVKQSIYSFQGARPDLFSNLQSSFKESFDFSNREFIQNSLAKTYRLPKGINNYIKDAFQDLDIIEKIEHLESHRNTDYSKIEIYPLIAKHQKEDLKWPLPDKVNSETSVDESLAEKIALKIKYILDSGLNIASEKRKVEEDDFLILVQKRSNLSKEIESRLQKYSIRIAGQDRVLLSENIAVKDVLYALKYIVNKSDKYIIFNLFKSSLFNLSDEEIKKIALETEEETPEEITKKLNKLEEIYRGSTIETLLYNIVIHFQIFDFYESVNRLDCVDALKAIIDEISRIAKSFQNLDITRIINIIETSNIHIKRELSSSRGVKIMTVHGSKGLESPFVILADSNDLSLTMPGSYKIMQESKLPLWSFGTKTKYMQDILEFEKEQNYREYLRLLYVALTRAKDQIIIFGKENSRTDYKSWYEICLEAAKNNFTFSEDGVLYYESGNASILKQNLEENEKLETYNAIIENYNNIEYDETKYKFGSKASDLGNIYHKILELYINGYKDYDLVIDILAKNYDKLEIKNKIAKALEHNSIKNLLEKECFAEAEFVALEDKYNIKLKRLDFLKVDKDKIFILDFKSDKTKANIEQYKKQLEEYKKIVSNVYSHKKIICSLFWLETSEYEEINII
jgi:ATP-dependent helicase/nuclease subunit A